MEKIITLMISKVKNGRSKDNLTDEGLRITSTRRAAPMMIDQSPAPLNICIQLNLDTVLIRFIIVL